VIQSFVVQWSNEWPEEMWGLRLGNRVSDVRNGGLHEDHRDELASIDFKYEKQRSGAPPGNSNPKPSSIFKDRYDSCITKSSFV
jgi:hypothetical protein